MTKFLWRLAFLLLILAPVAHAEVTAVRTGKSKQMRAFRDFEARVAQLENYSVVYTEAGGEKRLLKSGSARQIKKAGELTLELRPARPNAPAEAKSTGGAKKLRG